MTSYIHQPLVLGPGLHVLYSGQRDGWGPQGHQGLHCTQGQLPSAVLATVTCPEMTAVYGVLEGRSAGQLGTVLLRRQHSSRNLPYSQEMVLVH